MYKALLYICKEETCEFHIIKNDNHVEHFLVKSDSILLI